MLMLDVQPLYLLKARERGSPQVPSPVVGQRFDDAAKVSTHTSETPDPAYWTAYDYYMMERDARARRRAHIYSMFAAWGNRLWQRMSTPAAQRRVRAAGWAAFYLSDRTRGSG